MIAKITKEEIDELFLQASKEITADLTDQYISALNEIPDNGKNNPLKREVLAITIAQKNSLTAMREIIYKLFAEEVE